MCKIDIKRAFRLLPVLLAHWILLGICWPGQFFIDTRLPFGLGSSPAIFNRFADAVCWIIQNIYHILNLIHYSDDFFLVSPNDNTKAEQEPTTVNSAFSYLGVPIAEDKLEGPTTSLTYLGIYLNSSPFQIINTVNTTSNSDFTCYSIESATVPVVTKLTMVLYRNLFLLLYWDQIKSTIYGSMRRMEKWRQLKMIALL